MALRMFVSQNINLLSAQSYSKNFSLYEECIGTLGTLFTSKDIIQRYFHN